jgi:hypothetical protein
MPLPFTVFEQSEAVSPGPQITINQNVSGPGLKKFSHLLEQNGLMELHEASTLKSEIGLAAPLRREG